MKIKPLIIEDIDFISDLQPEGWDNILPKINFYIEADHCFPIKVVYERKMIGIGSIIVHHDTAWLGHIIVSEKERGSGIGKIITERLIEIAECKQCKTIHLIATDLGAPVYEKVGFLTKTEYLFFKNIKIENLLINFESICNYSTQYKSAIFEIDRYCSKEDRICELENHLEGSFVYKNNDTIEGFYLPTLGEGLIIANNAQAGN